jgi:hypothetical protein
MAAWADGTAAAAQPAAMAAVVSVSWRRHRQAAGWVLLTRFLLGGMTRDASERADVQAAYW